LHKSNYIMDYLQEKIQKILDDYILSRKLRKTKERNTILSLIYEYPQHFTVEELYIFMKKKQIDISRATLYNTIELLLECSLIKKHQFDDRSFFYEKAYKKHQHDHIICKKCGKIVEFCDPRLNQIIEDIAQINSFEILSHELYLFGICDECKKMFYD